MKIKYIAFPPYLQNNPDIHILFSGDTDEFRPIYS